jgi:hypothetical protein
MELKRRSKMTESTKVMVRVAFGGDCDPDPYSAARELREAGYDVHLLPNKYRRLLDHPFDDFLEAVIDGGDSKKSIRAAMEQVRGIVGRYGGGDIRRCDWIGLRSVR